MIYIRIILDRYKYNLHCVYSNVTRDCSSISFKENHQRFLNDNHIKTTQFKVVEFFT